MNGVRVACAFWLASPPPGGHSAVAVIELRGDVDAALVAMDVRSVGLNEVALRDVCGIDRGLVARWGDRATSVMAHAGPVVVRELLAAMEARGLTAGRRDSGCATAIQAYPEAATEVEARMLDALARAASPLAVDVLLAQPKRWGSPKSTDLEVDATVLNRLIDPPLVVAVGRPNIGKSTLLNALAGRGVSIVHDAPGTTRDYVGCLVNLAGLVVRWMDTPGLEDLPRDDLQRDAQGLAREAARAADLVLLCSDPSHDEPSVDTGHAMVVRVGLRADLGPTFARCDARVSVTKGEGLTELVSMIRETLVPRAAMEDERPWRFWPTTSAAASPPSVASTGTA